MKVLIDTNVFIRREEDEILSDDLQTLEQELKQSTGGPWLHPKSVSEIMNDPNPSRRRKAESRAESYPHLEYPSTPTPDGEFREHVPASSDENEIVDDCLLYAVYANEVDFLVTEDQGIHSKAADAGVQDRVFTISEARSYFETGPRPISEEPDIEKTTLGELDIDDEIFDSLRDSYDEFEEWARDKSDRETWINRGEDGSLGAVLVIKPEETEAIGTDPELSREPRVKISTFKVAPGRRGVKLGERLLSVAFRRAVREGVEKIYLTYYQKDEEDKLVQLLEGFGFEAVSETELGETVFQKRLVPGPYDNPTPFKLAHKFYPSFYDGDEVKKHLVPVVPSFHDRLFPRYSDQTELHSFSGQSRAEGNSIRKAYISNAPSKKVERGDVLLFYRSEDSQVTSVGVCDGAHYELDDPEDVKRVVGKRSVFTDSELEERVNDGETTVLMFLWHFHLPDPVGLESMKKDNIRSGPPISTQEIDGEQYQYIVSEGGIDDSFTRN